MLLERAKICDYRVFEFAGELRQAGLRMSDSNPHFEVSPHFGLLLALGCADRRLLIDALSMQGDRPSACSCEAKI
jgi:hypothetical protein